MKNRNEEFIATVAAHSYFGLRNNFCIVRNVSWGLFEWGEADIICMNKNGYLIEGEIKISKQDFLNDCEKDKFTNPKLNAKWKRDIKKLVYFVPLDLFKFVSENTGYEVVGIDVSDEAKILQFIGNRFKQGEINKESQKLSTERQLKLARLGCIKYWSK